MIAVKLEGWVGKSGLNYRKAAKETWIEFNLLDIYRKLAVCVSYIRPQ